MMDLMCLRIVKFLCSHIHILTWRISQEPIYRSFLVVFHLLKQGVIEYKLHIRVMKNTRFMSKIVMTTSLMQIIANMTSLRLVLSFSHSEFSRFFTFFPLWRYLSCE